MRSTSGAPCVLLTKKISLQLCLGRDKPLEHYVHYWQRSVYDHKAEKRSTSVAPCVLLTKKISLGLLCLVWMTGCYKPHRTVPWPPCSRLWTPSSWPAVWFPWCSACRWRCPAGHRTLPPTCTACQTNMIFLLLLMFHTSLKVPTRTSFSPRLIQPVKHTWLISLCLALHWRSPSGHNFLPLTCTVCQTDMSDFSMFRSLLKMPSRTSYSPTNLYSLSNKHARFLHVLNIAEDPFQDNIFFHWFVQHVKQACLIFFMFCKLLKMPYSILYSPTNLYSLSNTWLILSTQHPFRCEGCIRAEPQAIGSQV